MNIIGRLIKGFLADILFVLGNRLVIWSAKLCGYHEKAIELHELSKRAWRNRIK